MIHRKNVKLRSRVRIEVRPTENDSTRLYKNGDISVVIMCSWLKLDGQKVKMVFHHKI